MSHCTLAEDLAVLARSWRVEITGLYDGGWNVALVRESNGFTKFNIAAQDYEDLPKQVRALRRYIIERNSEYPLPDDELCMEEVCHG